MRKYLPASVEMLCCVELAIQLLVQGVSPKDTAKVLHAADYGATYVDIGMRVAIARVELMRIERRKHLQEMRMSA